MAEQLQLPANGGNSQQAKPQTPNTGQNVQTQQQKFAQEKQKALNQAANGKMTRQFNSLKKDFTELLRQIQDLKNNYQLDGNGQASVGRKIDRIRTALEEVTDIAQRLYDGDEQDAIVADTKDKLKAYGIKFKAFKKMKSAQRKRKKITLQQQQWCYRELYGKTRDNVELLMKANPRNVQINLGNNGGGQSQIGAPVAQPQQVNGANPPQQGQQVQPKSEAAPQGGQGGQGAQGQPGNKQQLAMYGDFGDYYADSVDVGGMNGIGDYGYGHRYIDGYDHYHHVNGDYVRGIGGSGVDNSMQFVYVTLIAMCIAVCMCCVCSLCGGIGAIAGYWMNNVMQVMERDNVKKVNYAIVNENGDESEV